MNLIILPLFTDHSQKEPTGMNDDRILGHHLTIHVCVPHPAGCSSTKIFANK